MTIDYARAAREHRYQKSALTRAVKSGDPQRIIDTVAAAVTAWNEWGAWPDDWHRWQNAFDAASGFDYFDISGLDLAYSRD